MQTKKEQDNALQNQQVDPTADAASATVMATPTNLVENTNIPELNTGHLNPDDTLAAARKAHHEQVKSLTIRDYERTGSFPSTVYFLKKVGDRYQKHLMQVPLEVEGNNHTLIEVIKDICRDANIVAFCSVYETWFTEEDKAAGRNGLLLITYESPDEKITSLYQLKDGKAILHKEIVENAESSVQTVGPLPSFLYSGRKPLMSETFQPISIKLQKNKGGFADVKKAWHDGIKSFAVNFYNESGEFKPMIFFLTKEGKKYKQHATCFPMTGDKDMVVAFIKKECRQHPVVAFCTVFESWYVEREKWDDLNITVSEQPDKKEVLMITCESREEKTMTMYELISGKAIYMKENIENADSDTTSIGRFSNILYSAKPIEK